MRRALVFALIPLVCCVAPAPTFGAYQGKAVATAEDMLSAVETANLTVETVRRSNSFAPFAAVTLAEAEHDGDAVQGAFDSVQPPDARSDKLRSELDRLLQAATSALTDLRIAARRTDRKALIEAAKPLPDLSKKLNDFAEANQ
jgi:hypothetical protein